MRIAMIDANEKANKQYAGLASSVIGGWLSWECQQARVPLVDPAEADIILLAFSGALDWRRECRSYLRKYQIETDQRKRQERPYIIAGGPVDAIPLTALETADAVAIGEAYNFVRSLLNMVGAGASLDVIRGWITEYPYAIEASQTKSLERDHDRPWLLAVPPEPLAEPDNYIDWEGVPPVRSDDKVTRIVASKGCHLKCSFCATTYRQPYQVNTNGPRVLAQINSLRARGERVQLLSNDPANLPYFKRVLGQLDSQSFTILEMGDADNRDTIVRSNIRMSRFGVEGISERIRVAFGKAITNLQLLGILDDLQGRGMNTHMFFVPGAPYETEDDWSEFRTFYEQCSRVLQHGICRVKFTKFLPTPPAPLARFVTDLAYEQRMLDTRGWISGNAASRHMMYIAPRMGKTYIENVSEQLSIPLGLAKELISHEGTFDLTPTLEDAMKLPWELVRWPIRAEVRWKIGNVYRDKMQCSLNASNLSRV